MTKKPTRDAYGHALVELAVKRSDVLVLDADLSRSTRTDWFAAKYPERFVNTGIAEQNLFGVAAGLALAGWVPFATTYAVFIGRGFDQIRQSIAFPHLNVKIVATHAGLAASHDGGSHQGIEDLALMRVLPGMTVLSPADYNEARAAVNWAAEHHGPVYIRLQKEASQVITPEGITFAYGRPQSIRQGTDVVIFVTGTLLSVAIDAAETLKSNGVSVGVVNVSTLKPIHEEGLRAIASGYLASVTLEEHSRIGGLYEAICGVLAGWKRVEAVAINDVFGTTGEWPHLREYYGLSSSSVVAACLRALDKSSAKPAHRGSSNA